MSKIKNYYHDQITQALQQDDYEYDYGEYLVAKAAEAGKQAHYEEQPRIPSDDPNMFNIAKALGWKNTGLIQRATANWFQGWDRAEEETQAAIDWIERIEAEREAALEIGLPF